MEMFSNLSFEDKKESTHASSSLCITQFIYNCIIIRSTKPVSLACTFLKSAISYQNGGSLKLVFTLCTYILLLFHLPETTKGEIRQGELSLR